MWMLENEFIIHTLRCHSSPLVHKLPGKSGHLDNQDTLAGPKVL